MTRITTVVRKTRQSGQSPDAVYIGRPSKWGNPYIVGKDGDRATVIAAYRRYFYSNAPASVQLRKDALIELKGKDLACFCSPLPCHGDVIAEFVNNDGKMELF